MLVSLLDSLVCTKVTGQISTIKVLSLKMLILSAYWYAQMLTWQAGTTRCHSLENGTFNNKELNQSQVPVAFRNIICSPLASPRMALHLCSQLIPGILFKSNDRLNGIVIETDYLCLMCLYLKSLLFLYFQNNTVLRISISNSVPITCRYLITSAITTAKSLLFFPHFGWWWSVPLDYLL